MYFIVYRTNLPCTRKNSRPEEKIMAFASFNFSDDVVLISGAGRGIGREMVFQFCKAGARVIAVDMDSENLKETAEIAPSPITTSTVDIRHKSQVTSLMDTIEKKFGTLDICVNNAAVAPHEGLLEYRESLWDTIYEVNCKGTFLMTQAAGALMVKNKTKGKIINFSSGAALRGGHGSAAYSSSRAATEGFSRVAAMELAPHGILVNTVRPGLIDTQPKPLPPDMEKVLEARIPTLPLQRAGLPEEVGNVVMFLASPLSGYMTGSVITVDGGSSVGSYSNKEIVDDDSRYFWFSSKENT
jgi:NAD(P)-dependent dehydrogenase (short-subunit alcohol dehydrogenase family)